MAKEGKVVDEKKWALAMEAAEEIRGLWAKQTLNFLEIGEKADKLKASKLWTNVCSTWGTFCEENLGKSPTTVRVYASVFQYFVASGYLTHDQASSNGPRMLTWAKAKVKKLTDTKKGEAKTVLVSELKETDKKKSIVELLPKELRNAEAECDKVLDYLDKVLDLATGIDAAMFAEDFLESANERMDKIAGCLVR